MSFSATDIQQYSNAFNTFCRTENKTDAQVVIGYLFDVLHRDPAEQDAERIRWLEAERREAARLLPSVQESVVEETARQQARVDKVDGLIGKLQPSAAMARTAGTA